MEAKLSSSRMIWADSLATSVPCLTHGDADVRRPQRRGVVDPVAGHGHHLIHAFEGGDDLHLLLRRGPGKDAHPLLQLFGQGRDRQLLELIAGEMGRFTSLDDPGLGGDRERRGRVIAGDHQHIDPGAMAFCHRLRDLRPHRVFDADEPGQDEILLKHLRRILVRGDFAFLPAVQAGDRQPQSPATPGPPAAA